MDRVLRFYIKVLCWSKLLCNLLPPYLWYRFHFLFDDLSRILCGMRPVFVWAHDVDLLSFVHQSTSPLPFFRHMQGGWATCTCGIFQVFKFNAVPAHASMGFSVPALSRCSPHFQDWSLARQLLLDFLLATIFWSPEHLLEHQIHAVLSFNWNFSC